ncbi:MAG: hypothetical protein WBV82_00960 [Myxococcaceae bacterium]
MAIPPDPIEQVLPDADAAVIATVTRVVAQDTQQPFPKAEPGATSVPGSVARQVVELEVTEVLFGDVKPGAKVQVVKPAGSYTLSAGNGGPFLLKLKGETEIVGRYGPDSYSRERIEQAARQAGRR